MKHCGRCKQDKITSEFSPNKQTKDGLHCWCKACRREYMAELYRKNDTYRDEHRAEAKQYSVDNREKRSEYAIHYYHNTIKQNRGILQVRRVRAAVQNAIRNGTIAPANTRLCSCGKVAAEYHHHNGYSKRYWLDVVPMCADCHAKTRSNFID